MGGRGLRPFSSDHRTPASGATDLSAPLKLARGSRPQGCCCYLQAQTLPESQGYMQKVKKWAAATPFLISTPPARSIWYIPQSPAQVRKGGVDWLGILEGRKEPHKMANGKTRWAYQTCQMERREDAFKGNLFVALRSRHKTKPEFSSSFYPAGNKEIRGSSNFGVRELNKIWRELNQIYMCDFG